MILPWLGSASPKNIVHGCFFVVFLILTTLTWREALILKETYEINQRDHLNTFSNSIERQGQRSVDELHFYRNMLQHALAKPVKSNYVLQELADFQHIRHQPVWHLSNFAQRSIPINGVSDAWLHNKALLGRVDTLRLEDELSATMDMSAILQLQDPARNYHSRLWYISRAGFYLSSTPPISDEETMESYAKMIARPYFTQMSPENNPERKQSWTGLYDSLMGEGKVMSVSLPVDFDGHWYGVLAMDFKAARIKSFLIEAKPDGMSGNVLLYNGNMERVAMLDDRLQPGRELSAKEMQAVIQAVSGGHEGALRFGTRFVTWVKNPHFGSVMVNIQTLREGVQGDTGRASVVLVLMWILFSLVLLFSHQQIIRLIGRMMAMQDALSWRANYDSLTRLLNRGAFFEQAEHLAQRCARAQQPFSVIQLDLDRFKSVNDTWGHHAGDLVLNHAAGIIQSSIRTHDVAGRVGGEEFCIVLPDTGIDEAVGVAERLRARLASKEVLIESTVTLKVTASLGVSCSAEQGDYQFESLQSIADGRLYRAKTSGRNRVCPEG